MEEKCFSQSYKRRRRQRDHENYVHDLLQQYDPGADENITAVQPDIGIALPSESQETRYVSGIDENPNETCDTIDSGYTDNEVEQLNFDDVDSDVPDDRNDDPHFEMILVSGEVNVDKFTEEYRNIAVGLSNTGVNALYNLISPVYSFLPKDPRTIKKTPKNIVLTTMPKGKMHYLGIEKNLIMTLTRHKLYDIKECEIDINVDGVTIFKNATVQEECWPILGRIVGVKNSVFNIAVYYGPGKPPVNEYFQSFIEEYNNISENGISYNGSTLPIRIRSFCCDAPARAHLKGIKGHTGHDACERCEIHGSTVQHKTCFPTEGYYLEREDEQFVSDEERFEPSAHFTKFLVFRS